MPSDPRPARGSSRGRRVLALALATVMLAGTALAAHASAQTMIEPERIAVTVRGAASAQDPAAMRRAIGDAAERHGWRVTRDQPGCVTLTVASSDLSATVDVFYDAGGFQIKYRSSVAMDYAVDDGRILIHPRYNKWITELGNEIRRGARNAVPQRRHSIDAGVGAPGEGPASAAGS